MINEVSAPFFIIVAMMTSIDFGYQLPWTRGLLFHGMIFGVLNAIADAVINFCHHGLYRPMVNIIYQLTTTLLCDASVLRDQFIIEPGRTIEMNSLPGKITRGQ